MFQSLRIRNYRRYATGTLISNAGTWMQRVAQDWLVLTELTPHSAFAVGVTTGLQFLPILLLSPWAGLLADRLPRRKLMIATQAAMGLLAVALGLLVSFHLAHLWMVYLFAFALGAVTAIDAPARQTFVSELVPPEQLGNAVALNSASFNAGRLLGPGIAGLLIAAFGTGPVFLLNGASFIATITALTSLRLDELQPTTRAPREPRAIRAGLAYVKHRPDLQIILGLAFLIGTFGMNFQMTTALMATQTYGRGAGEYGLLGSIMAIGSLSGALLAARRANPQLSLVLKSVTAFGVFAGVSALMPTYWTFAISLIPTGMSALTVLTACNTIVQSSTDASMRGRVMALYMAVFMGGTPLGSPIIGWVGEYSARWTILIGSLVALAAAAVAALLVRRLRISA